MELPLFDDDELLVEDPLDDELLVEDPLDDELLVEDPLDDELLVEDPLEEDEPFPLEELDDAFELDDEFEELLLLLFCLHPVAVFPPGVPGKAFGGSHSHSLPDVPSPVLQS